MKKIGGHIIRGIYTTTPVSALHRKEWLISLFIYQGAAYVGLAMPIIRPV
jgi:hypothetical protein